MDVVPPRPTRSLQSRARRGTFVTVGGQAASQGLRLVSNLVLSRLLFPEAFGLMALVNVVTTGLQMMSHVGIQPAIVRHERGEDPTFLHTAWSLQVIRGVLLCGLCMALAIPVARFYGEPQLAGLLAAASLSAVLSGLFSTKLVTSARRLLPGRPMLIEIAGQLAAFFVMVAIAVRFRSVWALVIGGLVATTVRLLLSHVALPGTRDRMRWDREVASEILSFGKWIFVSTLFTFLALRMDVVLLGKLLPIATLGVYAIGILLPTLLRELSARLIQLVLMPALSESHRQGRAVLAANFERSRDVVLPAALFAALGVVVVAPAFFAYLYDERYADAGWIAQLSMLGFWFGFLHDSSGRVLLATGDSRSWAASTVVKTLGTGVGCLVGFMWGELPGLVLGAAAGAGCGYAVVAGVLSARGFHVFRRDLGYSLFGAALGLASVFTPRLLAQPAAPEQAALLTLAVGAVLLSPYALWVGLRLRRLGWG